MTTDKQKRRLPGAHFLLLLTGLLVPFLLPFWVIGIAWWKEVADVAHFLAFGLIGVLIYVFLAKQQLSILICLLASFTISLLLSASTELVQAYFHTARSGNWGDIARNCAGTFTFLLLIVAFMGTRNALARIGLVSVATLCLLFALQPLYLQWQKQQARYEALPLLHDFNRMPPLTEPELTHVQKVSNLAMSGENSSSTVFAYQDDHWGGIRFSEVWTDWNDYDTLYVELTVKSEQDDVPFQIWLVHTENLFQIKPEWSKTEVILKNGHNKLAIPFHQFVSSKGAFNASNSKVQYIDFFKSRTDRNLLLSFLALELR